MTATERLHAEARRRYETFVPSSGDRTRRCPECGYPVYPLPGGTLPSHKIPSRDRYCKPGKGPK